MPGRFGRPALVCPTLLSIEFEARRGQSQCGEKHAFGGNRQGRFERRARSTGDKRRQQGALIDRPDRLCR